MHENQLLSKNAQLGDIGETEIKSRLQRFSTVTKMETDVGIDFYCELCINNIPVTPFYVQAKSSQHFNSKHGRPINKTTISYWLLKSHPVYIIFYDKSNDICYWKSIEEDRYRLMENISMNDGKKTIYIKFSNSNILQKNNNNEFKDQLGKDSNNICLFRGSPRFIGNEYVKQPPPTPRTNYEYIKIKENARAALYSLIIHHMKKYEYDDAIKYSEAVALFDNSHYNHFAWLGYLYKERSMGEYARLNFKKAIDICNKDKKWKSINKIIERLESEINDLQEK